MINNRFPDSDINANKRRADRYLEERDKALNQGSADSFQNMDKQFNTEEKRKRHEFIRN